MSAATTRLAEATIEVCARLAMAEEQARRDAGEIERLTRCLTLAKEAADEQIGDLLSELAHNERRFGLSVDHKGSPMRRLDRIVDKLCEMNERLKGEHSDEVTRLKIPQAQIECESCQMPRYAKICTVCGTEQIPF